MFVDKLQPYVPLFISAKPKPLCDVSVWCAFPRSVCPSVCLTNFMYHAVKKDFYTIGEKVIGLYNVFVRYKVEIKKRINPEKMKQNLF